MSIVKLGFISINSYLVKFINLSWDLMGTWTMDSGLSIFDRQQIGEILRSESRCLKIHNVIQSPCQQIGQSVTNLERQRLHLFSFRLKTLFFKLSFIHKLVETSFDAAPEPHLLPEPESEVSPLLGN